MDPQVLSFEYEWTQGDREEARKIAKKYIEDHAQQLEFLTWMTTEGLVKAVESYRAKGDEESRIVADMFIVSQGREQKPPWRPAVVEKIVEELTAAGLVKEDDDLQQWVELWKTDKEAAKEAAKYYVTTNKAALKVLEKYTLEDLVERVEGCRESGNETCRAILDAWLLSEFPAQVIRGSINLSGKSVVEAAIKAIKGE